MTTVTAMTKPASAPVSLFWTPSSRSIICSARCSASALISAAGWCSSVTSSLIASPEMKSPARGPGGAAVPPGSVDLDALLAEVLHRARVPGQRRGFGLLVLELEVLRLLVHANQLVAVVEHRLEDVVGGLFVHRLVRHQQVHHRGLLVVGLH